MLVIKYAVILKPGLRERSAKPLFVGSNPTHDSTYIISIQKEFHYNLLKMYNRQNSCLN